ncbi:MAG: hypothetical protein PVH73_05700 [Candidatus Bathyarchaeota archaeon]|jgi:hypothetical protein
MATQLDSEKRKKRTEYSDIETNSSQVLLPPTPEERAKDLMVDQNFCVFCECYHKPNAKLRCAFNRAINKIEAKISSRTH